MWYPYDLFILSRKSDVHLDADGFKIGADGEWVRHCACYEQVSGSTSVSNRDSGQSYGYASILFIPPDAAPVAEGVKLQVRHNGSIRFEGVARRFSADKEHCRIFAD
jgi:hypothetical protein